MVKNGLLCDGIGPTKPLETNHWREVEALSDKALPFDISLKNGSFISMFALKRPAGRFEDLELHRALDFFLHSNRAISDPAAGDYVADALLNDVAAAQLAIDRKVEKRSGPEMPVLAQPKSKGPTC